MFLPNTLYLNGLRSTPGDTRSLCKILIWKYERIKDGDNSGDLSIHEGILRKGMLKTGFEVVRHIELILDMVCHRANVIMAMNIWIV